MGHAGDSHDDEPLDEHHDDEGPDRPRGAPPDPLDRVWRHPTELSALPLAPPGASRRLPAWVLPLLSGAAGALVTVGILAATGTLDRSSSRSASTIGRGAASRDVLAVVQDVGRSVVAVSAGNEQGERRGSGVCVRHSGGSEILTSARLVGEATVVQVTTADGGRHAARVIGRDPTTDLALIAIDASVPAAELAERGVAPGNQVWIVGASAPGTPQPWMSGGLVASVDALLTASPGPTTAGLVETDAASNAWSAGGALVDGSGNVAGIVLAPITGDRTTYAVPIGVAVSIAADLRTSGFVAHGSLGLEGRDGPSGPVVTQVEPDGPAAHAGIRQGDVVLAVDDRDVISMDEVVALVRRYDPGKVSVVEVQRGTDQLKMPVTLASTTPVVPPALASTSAPSSG